MTEELNRLDALRAAGQISEADYTAELRRLAGAPAAPPAYYPPPGAYPPGYTPPPPPRRKHGRGLYWFIGIAALVLIIIVVAAAAPKTKKAPASAPAPTFAISTFAPFTPADVVPTSASPRITKVAEVPPKKKVPVTVLNQTGSGIKQTADFTVTADQWTIAYAYNCANFGSSGNFTIEVDDADGSPSDIAVNELRTKNSSSTVEHGAGRFYLSIDSECDWHVKVVEVR